MNRFSSDDVKVELESFKADINLPSAQSINTIQQILDNICSNKFNNWGPIELLETRVLLSAYSVYLTQEENRLKSFISWCESNIEILVGKELENCAEYGYNAKTAFIKAHNENVAELDEKRMLADTKLQIIYNLSFKIHALADSLKDLAYMKDRVGRNI